MKKHFSLYADEELIAAINRGDRAIFEWMYDEFAGGLLQYVFNITKDKVVSEDIVHDIFTQLWSRRETLAIQGAIHQYLFSTAKYKVLSYMRSLYVQKKYAKHFALFLAEQGVEPIREWMDLTNLQAVIDTALEELPPKCRHAFRLSRFKFRSIPEIAEEMEISTRTVENYITLGLKTIRKVMKDYTLLCILLLEWTKR